MSLLIRTCATCTKPLIRNEYGQQQGWYCCDNYYCSPECLDKRFEGTGETWAEHYDDDGDCYWTEWEDEEDDNASA